MNPPCVILNAPQLAENIGAVARVMANFGLSDLRMVRPRDGWPQERAWASASGADWPLDNAQIFDRLEDACADLHLLYATTARPREARLPVITPRQGASELVPLPAKARRSACCLAVSGPGWKLWISLFVRRSSQFPLTPNFGHSIWRRL